jgi:thioesterase domain-containing protein/aryl carrier-like protein
MTDIEKKIAGLTPAQRKVLEQWLQAKAGAPADRVEIDSADNGEAPLSYAQQRLWFLHQFQQEGRAYHILSAQRLQGQLNIEILEKALEVVSTRQRILRTVFKEKDGRVTQKSSGDVLITLKHVDLSHLDEKEGETAVFEWIVRLGQNRMEMKDTPPWGCYLFKMRQDEYILFVIQHHIISDGWSLAIFYNELSTAYQCLLNGENVSLPELPFQYSVYARKQQVAGYDQYRKSLDFWKLHLSDVHTLCLPLDFPRPAVFSNQGGSQVLILSQKLSDQLKAFCLQHHVTPFTVMISIFYLMLADWSGQADFAIGFPVSGREDSDVENLIGLFVNTLVLKCGIDSQETYLDFLYRTSEKVFSALSHQDCPFEMLVDELKPTRDTSRNPLFQVMFAFQNLPSNQMDLPLVVSREVQLERHTTRFDLECHIRQRAGQFIVEFVYNTDLFKAETTAKKIALYQSLLENVIEQPHLNISHWLTSALLPLLKRPMETMDHLGQKTVEHPRDTLEMELHRLWQKLLGLSHLSIHDNFFDCGGTSLLALQLFARIGKQLGCDLPISILFEAPTIAHLAQLIRGKGWKPTWKHLVMLRHQGGVENLFLVPPAGGTSFYFASLMHDLPFKGAIYSFDPAGMLAGSDPHWTIKEMAEAYLEDVLACQPNGPYRLGGMCFGGLVAFEMACLLEKKGHEVESLFVIDSLEPASGPGWNYETRNLTYYQKRILSLFREKKWFQAAVKELRKPWLYFRYRIQINQGSHRFFTHLIRIHNQAQSGYTAAVYLGNMDLLVSEEFYQRENLVSRWGNLVNGNMQVEVLPGSAHRDLLHKPEGVAFISNKIENVLKKLTEN